MPAEDQERMVLVRHHAAVRRIQSAAYLSKTHQNRSCVRYEYANAFVPCIWNLAEEVTLEEACG